MTFSFESTPPHRISGIRILPIDASAIPERRQQPAFEKALDSYLDRLAQADQFSGVVLVTREGNVVFADAYGDAD